MIAGLQVITAGLGLVDDDLVRPRRVHEHGRQRCAPNRRRLRSPGRVPTAMSLYAPLSIRNSVTTNRQHDDRVEGDDLRDTRQAVDRGIRPEGIPAKRRSRPGLTMTSRTRRSAQEHTPGSNRSGAHPRPRRALRHLQRRRAFATLEDPEPAPRRSARTRIHTPAIAVTVCERRADARSWQHHFCRSTRRKPRRLSAS